MAFVSQSSSRQQGFRGVIKSFDFPHRTQYHYMGDAIVLTCYNQSISIERYATHDVILGHLV